MRDGPMIRRVGRMTALSTGALAFSAGLGGNFVGFTVTQFRRWRVKAVRAVLVTTATAGAREFILAFRGTLLTTIFADYPPNATQAASLTQTNETAPAALTVGLVTQLIDSWPYQGDIEIASLQNIGVTEAVLIDGADTANVTVYVEEFIDG